LVKKQNPRSSYCFSSTIRTLTAPPGVLLATAMALGSWISWGPTGAV
jgi:hypothetical protein